VPREGVDTTQGKRLADQSTRIQLRIREGFPPAMSGKFEVWDGDPTKPLKYKQHNLQTTEYLASIVASYHMTEYLATIVASYHIFPRGVLKSIQTSLSVKQAHEYSQQP
jgi:hypothetical protein